MGCTTDEDYVKLKIEFEKAKKEVDGLRQSLADCTDKLNDAHLENATLGDKVGHLQAQVDAMRQALFVAELDKNEAQKCVRHLEDVVERQRQRIVQLEEGEDAEDDLEHEDECEDEPSDIEQMACRIRELEAAIVRLVLERV